MVRDLGTEPYLVTIEDEALISADVMFVTHDGATWAVRDRRPELNRFAPVVVRRRAFVGARSILLPGAVVGERSIIGAGSVVAGVIPDGVVAAGVPARVIATLDEWVDKIARSSLDLDGLSDDERRARLCELVPPA